MQSLQISSGYHTGKYNNNKSLYLSLRNMIGGGAQYKKLNLRESCSLLKNLHSQIIEFYRNTHKITLNEWDMDCYFCYKDIFQDNVSFELRAPAGFPGSVHNVGFQIDLYRNGNLPPYENNVPIDLAREFLSKLFSMIGFMEENLYVDIIGSIPTHERDIDPKGSPQFCFSFKTIYLKEEHIERMIADPPGLKYIEYDNYRHAIPIYTEFIHKYNTIIQLQLEHSSLNTDKMVPGLLRNFLYGYETAYYDNTISVDTLDLENGKVLSSIDLHPGRSGFLTPHENRYCTNGPRTDQYQRTIYHNNLYIVKYQHNKLSTEGVIGFTVIVNTEQAMDVAKIIEESGIFQIVYFCTKDRFGRTLPEKIYLVFIPIVSSFVDSALTFHEVRRKFDQTEIPTTLSREIMMNLDPSSARRYK